MSLIVANTIEEISYSYISYISTTNHAIMPITSINTIIAIIAINTMIIITCVTWAKLSQDGLGPFFERTPLIARKVFSAGRSWRNGAEEPP